MQSGGFFHIELPALEQPSGLSDCQYISILCDEFDNVGTLIIVKMFTQQVICVDFPLELLSGPPKTSPFQLKQVSSFWK